MAKVRWGAKQPFEYVDNYKILQDGFKTNNIGKVIDVQRLTLCRYQDNLEFCQWMKAYHGNKWSGAPYDPIERRKNATVHYILGGNKVAAPP